MNAERKEKLISHINGLFSNSKSLSCMDLEIQTIALKLGLPLNNQEFMELINSDDDLKKLWIRVKDVYDNLFFYSVDKSLQKDLAISRGLMGGVKNDYNINLIFPPADGSKVDLEKWYKNNLDIIDEKE